MIENEPLRQLRKAGYEGYVQNLCLTEHAIVATADVVLVDRLAVDLRFKRGIFYAHHREMGKNLTEFRSFRGEFGYGSLQIVMDTITGAFYADCDKYSAYQDLANMFGHLFLEVIPHGCVRLWRKLKALFVKET